MTDKCNDRGVYWIGGAYLTCQQPKGHDGPHSGAWYMTNLWWEWRPEGEALESVGAAPPFGASGSDETGTAG